YASIYQARRGPYSLTSGGPGSGLFRSTDGGATWEEITDNPGMPKGLKGKIGLAASGAQSGRVWAIVENEEGGVYRSDDGGDTWERLNEDRRLRQRAWYYSHIYADPKDASTVWVLNVEMFRSVDGGKTFDVVPAPHGDNHDLWIDPADPRRMILGNDGGGTVSYNGGVSWSHQYNQPTSEFYHVATDSRRPYRVYGSQQDNTSMSVPSRSNHGVITRTEWYEVGGGEAGYIAIRPDNPNIIFAGEYQGYMTRLDHESRQARSISVWPEEYSGSGAEAYKYRFQWTYPIILSPHDPNVLYCGGNHVFKSTNEGSSWEAISPDLTRNDPSTHGSSGGDITKDNTGAEIYGTVFTIAESPIQQGMLWAGSDDGRIHVSRNGGGDWTEVTPPDLPEWSLISLIEASPHAAETAYVAANRYKHDDFAPYLFKTTDAGATWTKITGGIPDDDFTRVIREDPGQRDMLYAGTATGIFVSYDGGVNWKRLGGNLPVVPIHDFVFTEDDLVVATHGRSFWILDDVTLIRQLAARESTDTVTLVRPRDTVRYGSMLGFGHSPVPGKNYSFAATQVPAYMYEKSPDGEVKTHYLDAGENPPDGVIVNYLLPEEPADPISLAILDADGNELRVFKSKPKKDEAKKDEKEFPPAEKKEDEDDEKFAPAKAGLNRFVWDFRLPKATKIATKGGDQPGRDGPKVVPGTYQVRLTVGDESQTHSFQILGDPRVSTTPAEYQEQFALLKAAHDKHDELNRAVNQIRAIRTQATDWAKRVKGTPAEEKVVAGAKSLVEKLDEVEGALLQVKVQSDQDTLNFPVKLNSKLAALAYMVGGADAAPTKQAGELLADLTAKIDEQLGAFKRIFTSDLPAFNDLIAKSGTAAIVLDETK
ncbi:MAG: glycosyl hydrolase, partial [Thermomicrobiales bacterium]|nr:glycosyl hydrolase [Thermomicrobiales bacterium]